MRSGNLGLVQRLFPLLPADAFPPRSPCLIPDCDLNSELYFPHWSFLPLFVCELPGREGLIDCAIRRGHVDVARWLMDNIHLLGGGEPHPHAAPAAAVASGSLAMLKMVWERCNPRFRGRYVLGQAVRKNNVAAVRWLLEREDAQYFEWVPKANYKWHSFNLITVFEWACKH